MAKSKRNIGREILEGIREIKRGEHGRVINMKTETSSCSTGYVLKSNVASSARRFTGDCAQKFGTLRCSNEADELMVVCSIHDHTARIRSCEIVAEVARVR
ncbi:MAG: hypothetical protein ACR2HX_01310 [Pyrinomonadaceae bacterium]